MSDTGPVQPQPAAPPQDLWSNRFTLIIGALGYLIVLGAVVVYLFQTQDIQIGLLIIGALIGILSQGQSWYNRGRVENPTQTRTGTGSGGASVAVQNAENVNAQPLEPAKPVPGGATDTRSTAPGSVTLRPPEPKP